MTAPLSSTVFDAERGEPARRSVFVLRTRQQRGRRIALALGTGTALVGAAALIAVAVNGVSTGAGGLFGGGRAQRHVTLPAVIDETAPIYTTEVMPLAPEEASEINAQRPVDIAAVIPARALQIARDSAGGVGYPAALRCLTQAVYYEAASEPDAGQQAVAQVVLNRVRHPAFPNTVCGVVYQGSQRVTGCQFSFTCDGSLARIPSLAGWARAERVARAALGGSIAPAVGNATHYHANYVVPYWAPTLDKVATVGAHIFYLMRGFMGSPRAFTSRYDAGGEVPQEPPVIEALIPVDEPLEPAIGSVVPVDQIGPAFGTPAEDARVGGLITGAAAPRFGTTQAPTLRADQTRGELRTASPGALKVDESRAPAQPPSTAAEPPGP